MKLTISSPYKYPPTDVSKPLQLVAGKKEYTNYMASYEETQRNKWKTFFLRPSCIPLVIILAIVIFVVVLPLYVNTPPTKESQVNNKCADMCRIQIVESIPEGLNFSQNSPKFMSTFEAWSTLIDLAKESLDIGSFYWTMRGVDVINHTSAADGEEIFRKILASGMENKFKIRIARSTPQEVEENKDIEILLKHNATAVRTVNLSRLLGGGVLHTKLWIVDNKHFYLGSANMDWRSLTQVKELGLLVTNCPCLAQDVKKIFNEYWYLGNSSTIPQQWPDAFSTTYNYANPLNVYFNDRFYMLAFFSSSPPPLSASGRTNDLDAIVNTILNAKSFVNIAVMDYFPLLIYTPKLKYWPYIDDAIRKAAIDNKVIFKILVSWWSHSHTSEDYFLRSLTSLSSSIDGVVIQVKRFIVPSNEDQSKIPFGRVNHNKYMVTDNTAYIGTSNWSGDYFTDTAGIGLVIREEESTTPFIENVRTDLVSVFERDWESPYAVFMKEI